MENIFSNIRHHTGDVYIADYTQYAKSHPESPLKGVTISDECPGLIESLKFENPNGVKLTSVNFEENQYFFRVDGGTVSNCECMLVSEEGRSKRWLALAELKSIGLYPYRSILTKLHSVPLFSLKMTNCITKRSTIL